LKHSIEKCDKTATDGDTDSSDDSISGFQFRYDIDTIFGKYRNIDIDIFKMMSM